MSTQPSNLFTYPPCIVTLGAPVEPFTYYSDYEHDEHPVIEGTGVPGWLKYFDGDFDRWFHIRNQLVAHDGTRLVADHRTDEQRDDEEWAFTKAFGDYFRSQRDVKTPSTGSFAKPRVQGRVHDAAVLQPTEGNRYNHWFPKGRVHAIAGASGAGKSTFMFDLLRRQANGAKVLGHQGAGYTYAVVFVDRGKYDNEETMERLGLDPNDPHCHYVNMAALDVAAAEEIKQLVEKLPETPDILFVEGADMLISKPADMQQVTQFLRVLGQVAEHYFMSVILSVGSGKIKGGDKGYNVQRESIYGTVAWGRKLSGVVCLNYAGDETNSDRVLTYSNRNARAEQFDMTFTQGGLLIEKAKRPEDVPPLDYWFFEHPDDSFTAAEALEGLKESGVSMSQPTLYRQLQDLRKNGAIAQRKRELPNGRYVLEYRLVRAFKPKLTE